MKKKIGLMIAGAALLALITPSFLNWVVLTPMLLVTIAADPVLK